MKRFIAKPVLTLAPAILIMLLFTVYVWADEAYPVSKTPEVSESAAVPDAQVAADPYKVTGNVTFSGLNRYILRGYELSSHSLVLEPAVTLSIAGFSLKYWSNIDTGQHSTQSFYTNVPNTNGKNTLDETDIFLSYAHSVGIVNLSGGYAYFGKKFGKETEEIFVTGGLNVPSHPNLYVYRDIAGFPGWYMGLGLSQSFPVYNGITADAGASFNAEIGTANSWNTYEVTCNQINGHPSCLAGYTGSKYKALHDGNLSLGFTIPVAKHFTVQPIFKYYYPLSNKAKETINGFSYNPAGHLDNTFVYGLNIAYNF
ncbi:MAG: hypothetical protein HQK89_03445 [Nitrospirae bacterium]|nr:hypothetical protein [Nitrospirota bacterium]